MSTAAFAPQGVCDVAARAVDGHRVGIAKRERLTARLKP